MQRLFFALLPSDELRQQFENLRRSLLEKQSAKAVDLKNLHITLAFLGNVSELQRLCFEKAADSLIFKPFELSLDSIGYWRRPQILWLGNSKTCPLLQQLVQALNEKFIPCGFKPDSRPYQAHITLARHYRNRQFQPIDISPILWTVKNIYLMQSTFLPTGVQYDIIRNWQAKN